MASFVGEQSPFYPVFEVTSKSSREMFLCDSHVLSNVLIVILAGTMSSILFGLEIIFTVTLLSLLMSVAIYDAIVLTAAHTLVTCRIINAKRYPLSSYDFRWLCGKEENENHVETQELLSISRDTL